SELLLCHGMVCVVGRMRDLILQLSKSSIYSTKPVRAGALNDYHAGENITIHFDMTKCHFFDAETEIAIR
ncbi:hypothetical protein, partial [Escherichia coli]|uniref:hypothetical protein n=3 Tax=Escherichia coli TaxID=562 RepID=UPI0019D649EA